MSKFKPGDLLVCVSNDVTNPMWKGTRPIIGNYYIWKKYIYHVPISAGYVEEIKEEINLQAESWYEKVDVDINIEQFLESSQLEEVC